MAAALVQAPSEGQQLGGAWSFLGVSGSAHHPSATLAASRCLQQQVQDHPHRDNGGGMASAATCSVPPPAAVVAAQQQPARRPRSRGCQHCVSCLGVRRYCHSAANLLQARRSGLPSTLPTAAEEWWPSGLSSPTLYFQLRRRQLHLQYKTSATAAASAKMWRPTQQTHNGPSALLAARHHRPLGLLIPTTFTNVQQSDTGVQLIGIKDVPLRQLPSGSPPAAAPLPTTAAAPLPSTAAATAAAAASKQRQLLMCCSEGDLPLLRRQASPAPLAAAGTSLRHSLSDTAAAAPQQQRGVEAQQAQRAQRSASLGTPTKRSRLLAPPAQPLLSPSPFAAPAVQQAQQQQPSTLQAEAAWWVPQAQQVQQQARQARQAEQVDPQQAEPWWLQPALSTQQVAVPQQAQQAQQAQQVLSTHGSLLATPECLPASLPHASWSARSSICLNSSSSFGSDGLQALQSHGSGSTPPASATSVLPPDYASLYPPAAAAPQQAQQALQQAQQAQQYLQRQYAMKAERAFPVVVDMPPRDPAESQPTVAAALASLLRLLKRGRDS